MIYINSKMTDTTETVTSTTRVTGCVKWFNNKSGFGFVSYSNGDIFVHHTSIKVGSEQYRYLVQGEYVEFDVSPASGAHEFQASNVSGINGGKLMCETRQNVRESKTQYKSTHSDVQAPVSRRLPLKRPIRTRSPQSKSDSR
jgi:CspA family cold shock protein